MKIIRILIEITLDIFSAIAYWFTNNLRNFARLFTLLLPYLMFFIGQAVCFERGKFAVGGEIFIPIFAQILIYYIRSTANKLGKGITIPVPEKRFTEVDEDGEVSIRNDRVQEVILYLADLEDWLERKGML